jgi:hypothetical protein
MYNILYSSDGVFWHTAKEIYNNSSLTNAINLDLTARYVRMQGLRRGTPYGFSIWEMEIYGKPVVESNATGSPRIYPNPAADFFSVMKGKDDIQYVEVYDATGRRMAKVVNDIGDDEVEVSVRGFARGIYMVTVGTASKRYQLKVVH